MGVDFRASVVVGLRLPELVVVRDIRTEVIRYREDTGQPYQTFRTNKVTTVLGVDVPGLDQDFTEQGAIEKFLGLRIWQDADGGKELREGVVGILLVSSNPEHDNPVIAFGDCSITIARDRVCEALVVLAGKLDAECPESLTAHIQNFLIASISC